MPGQSTLLSIIYIFLFSKIQMFTEMTSPFTDKKWHTDWTTQTKICYNDIVYYISFLWVKNELRMNNHGKGKEKTNI